MARQGENIRKRKDGRWEGRYLVYDQEKEKKVYRSVYAKSYEEVRQKLDMLKTGMHLRQTAKQAGTASPDEIRFDDIAQIWLDEIKEKRKPSTYIKYRLLYFNHIQALFHEICLSDLTDAYVQEQLCDQFSESVHKSIYCILNQILKFASVQYAFIMPVLRRSALDSRNTPVKVLAKSEQKKLMEVIYSQMDCFKMAVLMCLFTGLRLGELCALKWSDIDFENKILTVNRTVQRLYAEGHETKTILKEMVPKSPYSQREIPLSGTALELFTKFQNDKEYVFGGDRPLEPKRLQYHFKKLLKEASLYDKHFHILRHTFSTNCIEGGTDVKSLSEILGHSDVQITLNRYVHPSMETKRQYMDNLLGFYGQIQGQVG